MCPVEIGTACMRVDRAGERESECRLDISGGEETYASPKSLSLICPSGSNKKFYRGTTCQRSPRAEGRKVPKKLNGPVIRPTSGLMSRWMNPSL